jgi:hypothetical protein
MKCGFDSLNFSCLDDQVICSTQGIQYTIVHLFSYVAYVWVRGAKTTGPIAKVCFFLNLNFSAVENFKFGHMFCRNKKFCSVKSSFPVQILDNIGSIPVIYWVISMKLSDYYFFMPIYRYAKFRWKIFKKWTFVKHLFNYWMDRIET